jgi:hypothetical protein
MLSVLWNLDKPFFHFREGFGLAAVIAALLKLALHA